MNPSRTPPPPLPKGRGVRKEKILKSLPNGEGFREELRSKSLLLNFGLKDVINSEAKNPVLIGFLDSSLRSE